MSPRLPKRQKNRCTIFYRFVSFFVCFTFSFTLIVPPTPIYAQSVPTPLNLPLPGAMLTTSPGFIPTLVRGVSIAPNDPLRFNFIIDKGNEGLQGDALEESSLKLIKYFLAALTVPEDDMWVNLSPYEKDRIIPNSFSQTVMGRDLLGQDYMLKQLTASLMYPEDDLGAKFWNRVYKRAAHLFGTTDIPINTFNKVWIIPDRATVLEDNGTAYVIESHLKVMLEEDYVSLKHNINDKQRGTDQLAREDVKVLSNLSSNVVKDVLIPEIEKEVNKGKNFANLRQIYNSMILAIWYKKNLKQSLLGKVYVDQAKTAGIDPADPQIKEKIYQHYLEAFKQGVYDLVRDDVDPVTAEIIPRRYISGGMTGPEVVHRVTPQSLRADPGRIAPTEQLKFQEFITRAEDSAGADAGTAQVLEVDVLLGDNPTPAATARENRNRLVLRRPDTQSAQQPRIRTSQRVSGDAGQVANVDLTIEENIEKTQEILSLGPTMIREALATSMDKTKLLNDIAESVGIPDFKPGANNIDALRLLERAKVSNTGYRSRGSKNYDLMQNFFATSKLENLRTELIANSGNPNAVDLSPVRIQRITTSAINVDSFINQLATATTRGRNAQPKTPAEVVRTLKKENLFPQVTAFWTMNQALKEGSTRQVYMERVALDTVASPDTDAMDFYKRNGIDVQFSVPSNVFVFQNSALAVQNYQDVMSQDMALGEFNYRGHGTKQTVANYFENDFKPQHYDNIREFVRDNFEGKETKLRTILTNGIGANDQFMWALVKRYNDRMQDKIEAGDAPRWIHVVTASDVAQLDDLNPNETLHIDISRSGGTWEGAEIVNRLLQKDFKKMITLANGSVLKDFHDKLTNDPEGASLQIPMQPDIGGRNMHRKTPIYYTAQTVAGMFLPEMDSPRFAALHEKYDNANRFGKPSQTDPEKNDVNDGSLALVAGQFVHKMMTLNNTEHIAFIGNTEATNIIGSELRQYVMEGANKEHRITFGGHDLTRQPDHVLENLADSPAGQRTTAIAILDKAAPDYKQHAAQVQEAKKRMPLVLFEVDSRKDWMETQAALDIFLTDFITSTTTFLRVDANSNPNVKVVRGMTKDYVSAWRERAEQHKTDAIGKGDVPLMVSYGVPGSNETSSIGTAAKNQKPITTESQAKELAEEVVTDLLTQGRLSGRNRLNLLGGATGLIQPLEDQRNEAYNTDLVKKNGVIVETYTYPHDAHKAHEALLATSNDSDNPLVGDTSINIAVLPREAGNTPAFLEKFEDQTPSRTYQDVNGATINDTAYSMTFPNFQRAAQVAPTIFVDMKDTSEDNIRLLNAFNRAVIDELSQMNNQLFVPVDRLDPKRGGDAGSAVISKRDDLRKRARRLRDAIAQQEAIIEDSDLEIQRAREAFMSGREAQLKKDKTAAFKRISTELAPELARVERALRNIPPPSGDAGRVPDTPEERERLNRDLTVRIAALTEQIDTYDKQTEEIRGTGGSVEQRLQNRENEVGGLERERTTLRAQKTGLRIADLSDRESRLIDDAERTERTIENYTASIQTLLENTAGQNEIRRLEAQQDISRVDLHRVNAELASVRAALRTLTSGGDAGRAEDAAFLQRQEQRLAREIGRLTKDRDRTEELRTALSDRDRVKRLIQVLTDGGDIRGEEDLAFLQRQNRRLSEEVQRLRIKTDSIAVIPPGPNASDSEKKVFKESSQLHIKAAAELRVAITDLMENERRVQDLADRGDAGRAEDIDVLREKGQELDRRITDVKLALEAYQKNLQTAIDAGRPLEGVRDDGYEFYLERERDALVTEKRTTQVDLYKIQEQELSTEVDSLVRQEESLRNEMRASTNNKERKELAVLIMNVTADRKIVRGNLTDIQSRLNALTDSDDAGRAQDTSEDGARQITRLQKRQDILAQAVRDTRRTIKNYTASIQALRTASAPESDIEYLESQRATSETDLRRHEHELAQVETDIETVEDIDTLRGEERELDTRIAGVDSKLQTYQKKLQEAMDADKPTADLLDEGYESYLVRERQGLEVAKGIVNAKLNKLIKTPRGDAGRAQDATALRANEQALTRRIEQTEQTIESYASAIDSVHRGGNKGTIKRDLAGIQELNRRRLLAATEKRDIVQRRISKLADADQKRFAEDIAALRRDEVVLTETMSTLNTTIENFDAAIESLDNPETTEQTLRQDLETLQTRSRSNLSRFTTQKDSLEARISALGTTGDAGNAPRIPGQDKLGGIDLNPALLDLQIKRDGNGIPLPLNQQPIGDMKINGFLPVIINITPINVSTLPILGFNTIDSEPTDQQASDDRNTQDLTSLDTRDSLILTRGIRL